MNAVVEASTLEEIRAAETRLAGLAIRTPLIRLNHPDTSTDIYLKLENLQPVGAFKIRSLGNIIKSTDAGKLRRGVYTASSGNSGYALAWLARRLGIPATVYVPETAPEGKRASISRMGAQIKILPYADWWDIICSHSSPGEQGFYVDAVCDPAALAGNATIALEILQDLPEVDTIFVPFGGGGVSCGIASAVRALKPDTRVLAAESEMSTPFTSALEAGRHTLYVCIGSGAPGCGRKQAQFYIRYWGLVRITGDVAPDTSHTRWVGRFSVTRGRQGHPNPVRV